MTHLQEVLVVLLVTQGEDVLLRKIQCFQLFQGNPCQRVASPGADPNWRFWHFRLKQTCCQGPQVLAARVITGMAKSPRSLRRPIPDRCTSGEGMGTLPADDGITPGGSRLSSLPFIISL
jgi:hypothetical protein